MNKFIRSTMLAAIASLALLGGAVVAPSASADEVVGSGGISTDVTESRAGVVSVVLNAHHSPVGLDAEAFALRVRFSTGLDTFFVPRAENVYQLDVRTGDVSWYVYHENHKNYPLAAGSLDLRFPQDREVDVYAAAKNADGGATAFYYVNGREWYTECEPYSQTRRCFTDIWATQSSLKGGQVVTEAGWVFNNLTYEPSPRSLWSGNPLGNNGEWTAEDGRHWRTECDTAQTGRNGCRSYIFMPVANAQGEVRSAWVFNNIVRFS